MRIFAEDRGTRLKPVLPVDAKPEEAEIELVRFRDIEDAQDWDRLLYVQHPLRFLDAQRRH